MIQLILDVDGNNITLPESKNDGYKCISEPLMQDMQMISGRTTREYRNDVWVINYQYGYFSEEDIQALIAVCKKGMKQAINCSFLTQESNLLRTSKFLVTEYTRPSFIGSRKKLTDGVFSDAPVWLNFAVRLREVKPHA